MTVTALGAFLPFVQEGELRYRELVALGWGTYIILVFVLLSQSLGGVCPLTLGKLEGSGAYCRLVWGNLMSQGE